MGPVITGWGGQYRASETSSRYYGCGPYFRAFGKAVVIYFDAATAAVRVRWRRAYLSCLIKYRFFFTCFVIESLTWSARIAYIFYSPYSSGGGTTGLSHYVALRYQLGSAFCADEFGSAARTTPLLKRGGENSQVT